MMPASSLPSTPAPYSAYTSGPYAEGSMERQGGVHSGLMPGFLIQDLRDVPAFLKHGHTQDIGSRLPPRGGRDRWSLNHLKLPLSSARR